MIFALKGFSFEETYLPIHQYLIIDEQTDTLTNMDNDKIPFPVTDGFLLDSVIRFYLTHHTAMNTRHAALALDVDTRELSGAIHMLTRMTHEDFMHQYRLRTMYELLTTTTLSPTVIAKFMGYKSTKALNRFLVDQTGFMCEEIREGRVIHTKIKRPSWWPEIK